MRTLILLLGLLSLPVMPLQAGGSLVTLPSAHGVGQTMDKYEAAVKAAGMGVFARIDHAKGAAKVEMPLRPTELIIFGNPKIGTKLMQSDQRIGVDLPLKALAWEDADGKVWLGYYLPADLLKRHGIAGMDEVQKKMTGALAKFAKEATQP